MTYCPLLLGHLTYLLTSNLKSARPFSKVFSTQRLLVVDTNLGSGGPSESGFIDSLQRLRNTRKASFCRMCAKAPMVSGSVPPSSSDPSRGTPTGQNELSRFKNCNRLNRLEPHIYYKQKTLKSKIFENATLIFCVNKKVHELIVFNFHNFVRILIRAVDQYVHDLKTFQYQSVQKR